MAYVANILYPDNAAVVAVATQLAQRQSDSGTTNGGIVATGGSPTVPQLGVDPVNLGLTYFETMVDAIMSSVGFQTNQYNTLAAHTTSSTTYVDVPGTSFTFNALVAKSYTVHCDFSSFFSAGTSPNADVRLVVNGSNGPRVILNNVNLGIFNQVHLMHVASMAVGSNTIKLQWEVGNAAFALDTNGACAANYIVSG